MLHPSECMRVHRSPPPPLREDLGALYHLPKLLSKNNAPSVILINDAVNKSEGISCWRC